MAKKLTTKEMCEMQQKEDDRLDKLKQDIDGLIYEYNHEGGHTPILRFELIYDNCGELLGNERRK